MCVRARLCRVSYMIKQDHFSDRPTFCFWRLESATTAPLRQRRILPFMVDLQQGHYFVFTPPMVASSTSSSSPPPAKVIIKRPSCIDGARQGPILFSLSLSHAKRHLLPASKCSQHYGHEGSVASIYAQRHCCYHHSHHSCHSSPAQASLSTVKHHCAIRALSQHQRQWR